MSYYTQHPHFQVETSEEQFHFPSRNKAEDTFQNYVTKNIPCELYEDGRLQKQYKPS
jgi:hypothetical protein